MDARKKISTIKESIKESKLIEDYLLTLNEKYVEQQKKIEDLNTQLHSSFKKYKIFESKFFQTLYGKYSVDRISRVRQVKEDYYKASMELNERINELLTNQKDLLINKLKQNEIFIENLIKIMSYEEIIQNVREFQCDAFIENQIVYYSQEMNGYLKQAEEITVSSQECEKITMDLYSLKSLIDDKSRLHNKEETTIIQSSVLQKITGLPEMVKELDVKLERLLASIRPKLKDWTGRYKHIGDSSEHFRLLRYSTHYGKGVIETMILDGELGQEMGTSLHYQLRHVSWIISKVIGELLYLKHVILSEIEILQKDVIGYRNLQLELIKEQLATNN